MTILASLSLLLCAAVVVLWCCKGRFILYVDAGGERWGLVATTWTDGLVAHVAVNDDEDFPWDWRASVILHDMDEYSGRPRDARELTIAHRPRVYRARHGFGFTPDHELGYRRGWSLQVPYAFAAGMLLVVPSVLVCLRSRRPRPGHCTICSYDLRGRPERCPECGVHAPHVRSAESVE